MTHNPPPYVTFTAHPFVLSALREFVLTSIGRDADLVPRMEAVLSASHEGVDWLNWQAVKASLQQVCSAQTSSLPLARYASDHKLGPADLFVLMLVGECEQSLLVNLVLAHLQSPEKCSRPLMHTVGALLGELFKEDLGAASDLFRLYHHPMVEDGMLSVEGQGPLPLRFLSMPASVWNLLTGGQQAWPGCEFVTDSQIVELGRRNLAQANQLGLGLQPTKDQRDGTPPVLVLRGPPSSGRRSFAWMLAKQNGLQALSIPIETWKGNKALRQLCQYADWLPVLAPDLGPGEVFHVEGQSGPVAVIVGMDGAVGSANQSEVALTLPDAQERTRVWEAHLGNPELSSALGKSALLSGKSIEALSASAKRLAKQQNQSVDREHVHRARIQKGAQQLRLLAEPVTRQVDRTAMVLPESVSASLEHLIHRAKQRESLFEGLGDTLRCTKVSGVRALFVGESGTGKTLAASYLATKMGAPLYRVDLANVMNKYIGESEKNLSKLLDLAASHDVVLLFDEADSLFGSRSDGKETGERFANMLTNFLLTRIEQHPGIVVLTTNSEERIDNAFSRRIDVVVNFPKPGFEERLALWHSHVGDRLDSPDVCRLFASLTDLSGGQIRNCVLAAATCAEGQALNAQHLLFGVTLEYAKLGRQVPHKLAQQSSI